MPWLDLPRNTICVVLLMVAQANAEPKEAGKGQRDLRRYERAGPYILSDRVMYREDGPLIAASIRDFLWRHWHEHRLGLLLVTSFSIEGLATRTTYFIEPGKGGKWIILAESKYEVFTTKPGTNEHLEESATPSTICSLERIEPRESTSAPAKPISPTESRDGNSYLLISKDCDGKVLGER